MVHLDTAFDQESFDVAVRQAEAEIPADRDDDHVGWETAGGGRQQWLVQCVVASHSSGTDPLPAHQASN
jgi:hypothetical protein